MSKFFVTALCVCAAVATLAAPVGSKPPAGPIVVTTTAELYAALVEANAGRTVLVRAGTYFVDHRLAVPDGMQLEGEGVMLGDPLPTGFKSGTATRIRAHPGFPGDLLTLGDGASLRRLIVEDSPNREGNAVAVRSRAPGDSVSASIVDCEIVAPKGLAGDPDGPSRRRHRRDYRQPRLRRPAGSVCRRRGRRAGHPHDRPSRGARLLRHELRDAGPGPSRAQPESHRRHARGDRRHLTPGRGRPSRGVDRLGGEPLRSDHRPRDRLAARRWKLSAVPARDPNTPSNTSSNTVRIASNGDRIEAKLGIFAVAGRRQTAVAGLSSDNLADLTLRGLTIRTSGHGAADLVLHAAEAAAGSRRETTTCCVSTCATRRAAAHASTSTRTSSPEAQASGTGSSSARTPALFAASNTGIEPAPPAQFFDAISGP